MNAWPCRFSLLTYNLWNTQEWDRRRPALEAFLGYNRPDIIGVQELRAETRDALDGWLAEYQRVDDPLPGWTREGNLWWKSALFTLTDHGAEAIDHYEEHRRLFWVRLQPTWPGAPELLVANVHFTWNGNPTEAGGGVNPRYRQAELTVAALDQLQRDDQPVILMGDLNDFSNPIRVLRRGGYTPVGELAGRSPQPTWPAFFMTDHAPQAIDWVMCRGPVQPLTCEVLDFTHDGVPPSDHKPVQVVLELR